jgi:hypothetical protein
MASQKKHPMSGGIDPVRVDGQSDYLAMRRKRYDIELAPLPASLRLNVQDEALNRRAEWRLRQVSAR